ncbi:MAG: hypothetical protein AAFR84_08105 [Pseudomonadota bacterium]
MSENKRASACPAETLRKRLRQAERDAGERPSLTGDERASAFIFSAISVGTPPRRPSSTSILLKQSFSMCAKQPIFGAIAWIAEYRDECSAS